MYQVQQLTGDSTQDMNLLLPDGTAIQMEINFKPMMFGWFINSINYNNGSTPAFNLTGIRISNSPNMLRQWKNIIPFGLACASTNQREPSLQQDFSSGASILYILTPEEVEQFEEIINGN